MLIDVKEDLTVGAAGSPSRVAAHRNSKVAMVVVEVDVAAKLARASDGVAGSPCRLEFASGHTFTGGVDVEREPCQRTVGHSGTISVTNADPEPWLPNGLSTEVGVGPQVAGVAGDKEPRDRASEARQPESKIGGDGIGAGTLGYTPLSVPHGRAVERRIR